MTSPKAKDIRYVAQDILSRRDNSEYEIKQKLLKKGFPLDEIEATIAWLKSKKYLSDILFAQRYVAQILRSKAVGKKYIAYKLEQKKIARSIIEEVLSEYVPDDVEKKLAKKAAANWKKVHARHAADKNRLTRFLLSRGFSGSALQHLEEGQQEYE